MDKLLVRRLGGLVEVTLNSESTLNALDAQMARQLHEMLPDWAADESVRCVLFRGAGGQAFCAGGDIQSLYANMVAGDFAACDAFFAIEYRLDHALHRFPKPTLAWVDGFVMGGGMGVMQGCGFRVVTPGVRMAMPETHIGFLPDVGAGWFLNRRGDGLEWSLALAGGQVRGDDAVFLGLADFQLADGDGGALVEFLASLGGGGDDRAAIADWLGARQTSAGEGWMQGAAPDIAAALAAGSCEEAIAALARLPQKHPAAQKFTARIGYASPLALQLTWRHLHRCRGLDIAQVLGHEFDLVCQLCRHGEFAEGVRALIVDKDNAPRWSQPPASLDGWFAHQGGLGAALAQA